MRADGAEGHQKGLHYRVGLPGWKFAARLGVPVALRVRIFFDDEARVFVGTSPDLAGLVVEARTLDELQSEALACAAELLELQLQHRPPQAVANFEMAAALPA